MTQLYQLPVGDSELEPDGRDNWWTLYAKGDSEMNDRRIKLTSNLQFKWFEEAMTVCMRHKSTLSDYDRKFLIGLEDGYNMVGRELTITVKQMNHIRQIASELEKQHG